MPRTATSSSPRRCRAPRRPCRRHRRATGLGVARAGGVRRRRRGGAAVRAGHAGPTGDDGRADLGRVGARRAASGCCGPAPVPIPVFEALDHEGVLVRLLPEWEHVRSRPQRNAYHRFTVDRHLLEASRSAPRCSTPARPADARVRRRRRRAPAGGRSCCCSVRSCTTSARECPATTRRSAPTIALGSDAAHRPRQRRAGDRRLARAQPPAHGRGRDAPRSLRRERRRQPRGGVRGRCGTVCACSTCSRSATRAPPVRRRGARRRARCCATCSSRPRPRSSAVKPQPSPTIGATLLAEQLGAEAAAAFLTRLPRLVPPRVRRRRRSSSTRRSSAPTPRQLRSGADGDPVRAHGHVSSRADRPRLLATLAGALTVCGLDVIEANLFGTADGLALDVFRSHRSVRATSTTAARPSNARSSHALDRRASTSSKRVADRRRDYAGRGASRGPVRSARSSIDESTTDTFVEVHADDEVGLLYRLAATFADLEARRARRQGRDARVRVSSTSSTSATAAARRSRIPTPSTPLRDAWCTRLSQ